MAKFPWGGLIGFVVLIAVVFTLFQIGGLGLGMAGTEDLEQSNETLMVNYDNPIHVSFAFDRYTQGFGENVTINNSSGTELTEGDDYEWNEDNGSVTFIDTPDTSDGEQVNITYAYEYNVEEVRQGEPIVQILIERVPLWGWILFILFVSGLFLWLWSSVQGAVSTNKLRSGR